MSKSCDVMTSISTRGRKYLWIYLLNCKSYGHETWRTNRYSHEQYFAWFNGVGSKSRLFKIYQYIVIDQKPILMSLWFFTFESVL